VNTTAALRRLEHILPRLTGDKALRDEAVAIVRGMIDTQEASDTTTVWYGENLLGEPMPRHLRPVFDFVLVNGEGTKEQIARNTGLKEDTVYRYVTRANKYLHANGGKASISWDGSGVARTASISVVVCSFSPPAR
jgi:hypothetical protein